MQKVQAENAPRAIGPYSQAILVNGFLFCSGQIAINPMTNDLLKGNIEEQTVLVLNNLKIILEAAGFTLQNVVKTTCFLQNMDYLGRFNTVYEKYFPTNSPARSVVAVTKLPKDSLVEIDLVAYRNQ